MKKLLLSITILLSLFSCKKEEVYASEKLIGTWYVDATLVLPNGEFGFSFDSTISNITNRSDGKVYINNIFDSNNNSGPDLGFYATMIGSSIDIESQNFNFGTISGNGVFIDDKKFVLNTTWISSPSSSGMGGIDQYRFTFYK